MVKEVGHKNALKDLAASVKSHKVEEKADKAEEKAEKERIALTQDTAPVDSTPPVPEKPPMPKPIQIGDRFYDWAGVPEGSQHLLSAKEYPDHVTIGTVDGKKFHRPLEGGIWTRAVNATPVPVDLFKKEG